MRGRMWVALGLVLGLGVVASRGEWKMKVHEGSSVTEFSVAGIDSVTFYDDLSVPAMVVVPAGVFVMGDGVAWCGTDLHEVTLTRPWPCSAAAGAPALLGRGRARTACPVNGVVCSRPLSSCLEARIISATEDDVSDLVAFIDLEPSAPPFLAEQLFQSAPRL